MSAYKSINLRSNYFFKTLVAAAIVFPSFCKGAVGVTLSVAGQPILKPKGISVPRPLDPGSSLESGDLVTTDIKSTAKIHLIDQTILDVGIESVVKIPKLLEPNSPGRQVIIDVERGRIRAKINREIDRSRGRFEIHTKAAIMGVEGTDFVVDVQPNADEESVTTIISVIEGQVAVRSGKSGDDPNARQITLTQGMRYTATAKLLGDMIEQDELDEKLILRLDEANFKELAGKAQLTNKTFLHAVSLTGRTVGFANNTIKTLSQTLRVDNVKPVKKASADNALTAALFTSRFRETIDNQISTPARVVITPQ